MWQSSISRADGSGIVCTEIWSETQKREGIELLQSVLEGVGDLSKQRLGRFMATYQLHRACTPEEVVSLPESWHRARWGMAGAPLELVWSTVETPISSQPCEFPTKRFLLASRPDLWFPEECDVCDSCMARSAVRARPDVQA